MLSRSDDRVWIGRVFSNELFGETKNKIFGRDGDEKQRNSKLFG
jgi:hypothetical protein